MRVHADARILVIDDEVSIQRLLQTILDRAGYTMVRCVGDPRQAVQVADELAPDIVLLDVTMPELDGFEVLARLRQLPVTRDVPIVMITGDASAVARRRALAEGGSDFVTKPIDPAEVVHRIGNLLETRFLQLELHAHNRLLELTVQRRTSELSRYVQVLDAVRDPVAIMDPSTLLIQYANGAFAASVGRAPADVEGQRLSDLRSEWTDAGLRRHIEAMRDAGVDAVSFDSDMPTPAGDVRTSEVVLQRIRTDDDTDVLVSIARDIEDRREAEEALRSALEREHQARTKLRLVDEMKDAFLSAISHEIRTPLTVVLAAALTLRRRGLSLDEARSALLLDRLAANAQRLDRLLEDLLDLSRLTSFDLQALRTYVQVDEVIHETLEAASLEGRSVRLLAPPLRAHLDEDKLRRIMAHLLENVQKHTPPGTPVTVTVAGRGDAVHLTVADAGPGIPDELKHAVFEPFRHGHEVSAHDPGAGIGLALVATYVGVHGGSCWVEDEPGGGAAIHALLPAGAASGRGGVARITTDLELVVHEERSAS